MKNDKYTTLATSFVIDTTIAALKKNNISAMVVDTEEEAITQATSLIPEGSEVMTATSKTLEKLGLDTFFNDSGKYNSIKSQLKKLNREHDGLKMQKLGAAPEYVIGSVHAVTKDGKIVIASGSGSQLPSYSYSAPNVIWIVSTKKIVSDVEEGLDRIYQHILPLEDERMKEVYGPESGSTPRKILIINSELNPKRINIVFVKKNLGF
jgi:L-lactate utilization protein LutC